MYCTHCGSELAGGAAFCAKCGAPADRRPAPGQGAYDARDAQTANAQMRGGGVQAGQSEYPDAAKKDAASGKRKALLVVIGVAIGLLAGVALAAALLSGGVADKDRGGGSQASSASAEGAALSGSAESMASSSGDDPDGRDAGAASSSMSSSAESSGNEDASSDSGNPSGMTDDNPITSDASAGSTAGSSVFETESVRITMPRSYADAGYRWSSVSTEHVDLEDANGSVLASIIWANGASREIEAKHENHEIGIVSHGSIGFVAYLCLYRLDSEGKRIHWGKDEEGTLATEYMGVELREIVSWIELYSVGGFLPASLDGSREARAGNSSDFESPLEEPFYGVWVSASKDYDEARSTADELGNAGFTGYVFFTTDWNNLNTEPWYVVSAGYAKTEPEAQSLCERVRDAGYADAYVKYSGDYIGNR